MLVFAVFGSALFGLAHSLGLLVVGRFLIGLGFAGGMVGSLVVLSRWLDPGGFTRAMTLLFASANVGSLLATSPLSAANDLVGWRATRSEEHTSELQSLMRISYAVFCLKKKKIQKKYTKETNPHRISRGKVKCMR